MYSFSSRVRYSEVDRNKKLDLSSIINYFQDCSTFQSEDQHVGISYLTEHSLAWMLSSWQIHVNRFPELGEHITASTWAYHFDSMYGYRNFTLTDSHNEVCAFANSIWILVDLNTGHPCRLSEDLVSAYPLEEQYPMEYVPRKIPLPKEYDEGQPIIVTSSNLDTNNHVNNGQYIKMAEDFLPDDFVIQQMRAEYRISARIGDVIIPRYTLSNTECTVALCHTNNKPYAVVQFTAAQE